VKLSKEVKVGLLVTAALMALFWGLNYLKGIDLFTADNKYYAVYEQVDGLVPSSDIILSGVKIGQVNRIQFFPDRSGRILATLLVDKAVFVGKESTARIISADLLGGRAIEIILDSKSEPAADGDTLRSEVQTTLSDQVMPIKDKAESLIQSLDSLATTLKNVFNAETQNNLNSSLINLNKTLKSIERTSTSIDEMVSSDNGKLKKMIGNLESITANIKNNNEQLSNALRNISLITDSLAKSNLATTINNANNAIKETGHILEKINKGEGSMGMLINNDNLYNALDKSANDLDKLLIDIKQNPKRYIHFSVFGKSGKAK
jgi:phospholipid/cholesterol/gamma-HCH transport system substrate-binding protein